MTGFFVSRSILYKRNHDMVLLCYVNAKEAESMLGEFHEGSFGTHANGHAMARKILRAGYYWLTMESDCCLHVRKYHKCQTFANNVNAPPLPLNVLVVFHVGNRCDWGHRAQSCERTPFHPSGD